MPGDDKSGKRRRGSQYGHGHAQDHVSGSGGASEDLLGGTVDNPGAKHWSDEEKTKFFIWLLGSDEHWEQFGTKMNTCFREVRRAAFWLFPFFFLLRPAAAAPRISEMGSLQLYLLSSIASNAHAEGACRLTLFVGIGPSNPRSFSTYFEYRKIRLTFFISPSIVCASAI
jgi:hypothetical protein